MATRQEVVRAISSQDYERRFKDRLGEISSNLGGDLLLSDSSLGRYDDNLYRAIQLYIAVLVQDLNLDDWSTANVKDIGQSVFDAFSEGELSATLADIKDFGTYVQQNLPETGSFDTVKLIAELERLGISFLKPFVLSALQLDTPTAALRLSTMGLYLKKLQTPIEDELNEIDTLSWLNNEREVRKKRVKRTARTKEAASVMDELIADARAYIQAWFAKPANIFRFKHSGGQVREGVGTSTLAKNPYLVNLSRFDGLLKIDEFSQFIPRGMTTLDQLSFLDYQVLRRPEDLHPVAEVRRQKWIGARLDEVRRTSRDAYSDEMKFFPFRKTVPGDFGKVRGIGMESVSDMFIQQGVLQGLVDIIGSDPVLKVHANPATQQRQRDLAAIGSRDRSHATLDLQRGSDFLDSDFVSSLWEGTPWHKVFQILNTNHIGFMERDREIDVESVKFGNMGNTLTFPVQTAVYAALTRAVYDRLVDDATLPDGSEGWGVFGDDIIIAEGMTSVGRSSVDLLCDLLTYSGLVVNTAKSMWGSIPSRESCGFRGFGYEGNVTDITPLYYTRQPKDRLSSHTLRDGMRFIANANNAVAKGYTLLYDVLKSMLSTGSYATGPGRKYFPALTTRFQDTTALRASVEDVLKVTEIRYLPQFQRWEYLRWVVQEKESGRRSKGKAEFELSTILLRADEKAPSKIKKGQKILRLSETLSEDIGLLESLLLTDEQAEREESAYKDRRTEADAGSRHAVLDSDYMSLISVKVGPRKWVTSELDWSGGSRPIYLDRSFAFVGRPHRDEPKYKDFAVFAGTGDKALYEEKLFSLLPESKDDKLAFAPKSSPLFSRTQLNSFVTWYYGLGYQTTRQGAISSILSLYGGTGLGVLKGSLGIMSEPLAYDMKAFGPEDFAIADKVEAYTLFREVAGDLTRTFLRKMATYAKHRLDQQSDVVDERKGMELVSKWKPFVWGESTLPDDVWYRLISDEPADATERRIFKAVKVYDLPKG
jgi:hypothetical protein